MRHEGLLLLLCIVLCAQIGCDVAPQAPETAGAVFAEWRGIAEEEKRSYLAEEMIDKDYLIGMTREQVLSTLGEPNLRKMSDYGDPKYIVGPNGIDDMWLCIYIENGKVARTMLRSD